MKFTTTTLLLGATLFALTSAAPVAVADAQLVERFSRPHYAAEAAPDAVPETKRELVERFSRPNYAAQAAPGTKRELVERFSKPHYAAEAAPDAVPETKRELVERFSRPNYAAQAAPGTKRELVERFSRPNYAVVEGTPSMTLGKDRTPPPTESSEEPGLAGEELDKTSDLASAKSDRDLFAFLPPLPDSSVRAAPGSSTGRRTDGPPTDTRSPRTSSSFLSSLRFPSRPRTSIPDPPPTADASNYHAWTVAAGLTASEAIAFSTRRKTEQQEGARKRGRWQDPESPAYNETRGLAGEQRAEEEPAIRGGTPRRGRSQSPARGASGGEGSEFDQSSEEGAARATPADIRLANLTRLRAIQAEQDRKLLFGDGSSADGLHTLGFGGFIDEEEDSIYPEVRASVSNIDDPEMPALTFRAWFLGLSFTLLVTAANLFFSFRYPAPVVTPVVVQILAYPCGKILANILPVKIWRMPRWMRWCGCGDDFSFNPGPFNIKEHTLVVIMANAATATAYGISFSVLSQKFYGITQGVGFDMLLVLSSQMLGFSISGLCRRFLVWPAAMLWPQNLVLCTLLNTLHAEDDDGESQGGITRYRFFCYAISGAFLWFFLPGYLFQALSAFSFICWITPNNPVVNQLFGVYSGLGMSILTFDWAQIAFIGSPLVTPWWAEVNIFVGFVLAFWIIAPIMYYSNVWYSAFLPISTSAVFDRFGAPYNTSLVVTSTMSLDVAAYNAYSPLYLPITYGVVYCLYFALATAIIVHTALYHGKTIRNQLRRLQEPDDIHAKLMKHYPEVPEWWFWVHLVIFFALAVVTVAVWETQLPVWALIISIGIGFVYILPGGFIYALTNQQISANAIVDLIAGYLLPGQPLGNALFKVYSVASLSLALSFIQDLKLGHYMKIPPRATFAVQVVATCASAILQVLVKTWILANVPTVCEPQQAASLTCPSVSVYYSSSIIWGLIGPARQFGPGQLYNPILWSLLLGALLPVPFWLLSRRYPNSWLKYVNIPVLLAGPTYMPPATGINYSSWFLVGFVFQFWLRRRQFAIWSKFNFILSSALDAGTVLSGVAIFLALQLPRDGTITVNWWGNNVFERTDDWNGVPYLTPPAEGFGPSVW